MKKNRIAFLMLAASLSTPAFALDQTCHPVLDAITQRAEKASWRSMTHSAAGEMEYIKAGSEFFQYTEAGGWERGPDLDQAQQAKLKNILNGSFRIAGCKDAGTGFIRGTTTRITQYHIDMPGFPAAPVTLYTSTQDGLPYRQTYRDTVVDYYYAGIKVPRLP